MDEKDKFDGTEKIEEEEEKVYIARHAKRRGGQICGY